MKRFASYIVVAVVSLAIVALQRLIVIGADDFTLTPDGYKIFQYGFPFSIVDCAANLPMHMTAAQTAVRVIGNFVIFLFAGVVVVEVIRRFRTGPIQRVAV